MTRFGIVLALLFVSDSVALGQGAPAGKKKTAVQRGAHAVRNVLSPLTVSSSPYENAWKQWGMKAKPADYPSAFRERYGLHEAPFDNQGLPLGLHKASGLLGKAVHNDCLLCHAGRVAGRTIMGLGNASLDMQSLYDDMAAQELVPLKIPFRLSRVRGTVEAAASVFYLLQFRNPDLTRRSLKKLEFRDDVCEDIPAWWHLKRKKTMYHTGGTHARSVRSMMAFLLSPTYSAEFIKKQKPVFADIQAYLLSLEPPKYPFQIDQRLAGQGEKVFKKTCARCHGTYGPQGKYPNRIVALDVIGTDPTLATKAATKETVDYYLKTWFVQEKGPGGEPYHGVFQGGYQAPPLDGVWATAPYFHNGSAPTVYHVLNSKARPRIFTRSYRTGVEHYDRTKLGWKFSELKQPPKRHSPFERRKIYDTTRPGRGNSGHRFGDSLSHEERMAVIEYLKTL